MNEHIIRDCVLNERLTRALSEYYSRRMRGVSCPDLLAPEERASTESRYDQRLESARIFVKAIRPSAIPS